MSELFPDPATPVSTTSDAERDVDVDVLQVVGVRPADLQRAASACAPTP